MGRVGFKKLRLYPAVISVAAGETLLFEGAWTYTCPLLEQHPNEEADVQRLFTDIPICHKKLPVVKTIVTQLKGNVGTG